VNSEVYPAIEDCVVDFFFENSFLVEREEGCSLIRVTRGRDDRPVYSQSAIQLSDAICY
jgi:hypothetical protein